MSIFFKIFSQTLGFLAAFSYIYRVMRVQLLNPLNMNNPSNVSRFNRHELFDSEWMDYHTITLRMVENYHINRAESWYTPLYNMLCGVWDGYLYTEMLEVAKGMELPTPLLQRIANTVQFIGTSQK